LAVAACPVGLQHSIAKGGVVIIRRVEIQREAAKGSVAVGGLPNLSYLGSLPP